MWTITKSIEFCAGHRLIDYDGMCANVHGHNFTAEIHVSGNTLNHSGLLVDFLEIKQEVKKWIDECWDHAFLVNTYDNEMIDFLQKNNQKHFLLEPRRMLKIYWPGTSFEAAKQEELTRLCNPTVENLSMLLRDVVRGIFEDCDFDIEVTLYESPSGWVTTRSG